MEMIINLMKLGLDEKQAKVYLAGLKTGTETANVLASNSHIKRGTIYSILKELKSLGLCTESVSKKRKVFTMSDPNHLKAMQNEREDIVTTILPILRSFTVNKNIPKISIFQGIEEVRKVYYDTLKNTKEICCIESSESLLKYIGHDWIISYVKERIKQKIPIRFITINNEDYQFFHKLDTEQLRTTKFISKKYSLGIDLEIYANKVLIVSLSENPIAIIIEDEKIHKSMKNLFEYIWQTL